MDLAAKVFALRVNSCAIKQKLLLHNWHYLVIYPASLAYQIANHVAIAKVLIPPLPPWTTAHHVDPCHDVHGIREPLASQATCGYHCTP